MSVPLFNFASTYNIYTLLVHFATYIFVVFCSFSCSLNFPLMRVLLWFCGQLFSFRCRSVGCKTSWDLLRKERPNRPMVLHLATTGKKKNVIFRQGNQMSRPRNICYVVFRHKDIFCTNSDITADIATNIFSTVIFIPTIFEARLI